MSNPKRNKVMRLDATRLSEDDSLVTICIPSWFRRLLLDTTERYLWSRVWQAGDYEYQLTDEDKDRIAYAIYQLTIECAPMDNDCCEQIEDIISRLEELETMNINVNCGCGCGGCQDSQQDQPVGEDDNCLPDVPDNEPQNPQQQAKCIAANFMATSLEDSYHALYGRGGLYNQAGFLGYQDWWVSRWNVMPTPPTSPSYGSYLIARTYLVLSGTESIREMMRNLHGNLVCLLFQSGSKQGAQEAINSYSDQFPGLTGYAIRLLARYIDYDILFVPAIAMPGGYGNSCCGSVPSEPDYDLPAAPVGYAWLPIAPSHLSLDSSSGSGGVTPLETVGNGYIQAGFVAGSGGWDTTWDINESAVLEDGRLPSVGVEVMGVGMTFRSATLAGVSRQAYYGFPSYQNDWYFEAEANEPGATWLLRSTAAPSSLDALFDYANGSSGGSWTQFSVHHQGDSGYTDILIWWLVQL